MGTPLQMNRRSGNLQLSSIPALAGLVGTTAEGCPLARLPHWIPVWVEAGVEDSQVLWLEYVWSVSWRKLGALLMTLGLGLRDGMAEGGGDGAH